MTYLCSCCGAIIYEPRAVTSCENLDGENGVETRTVAECPFCGEEWFEEVEDDAES